MAKKDGQDLDDSVDIKMFNHDDDDDDESQLVLPAVTKTRYVP